MEEVLRQEQQQHRAESVAQQVHPFDEFIELRLTVHQDFFVCDDLGNLRREDEICRSLLIPACDGRSSGCAVERGIELDRIPGGWNGPSQPAAVKEEVPRKMPGREKGRSIGRDGSASNRDGWVSACGGFGILKSIWSKRQPFNETQDRLRTGNCISGYPVIRTLRLRDDACSRERFIQQH